MDLVIIGGGILSVLLIVIYNISTSCKEEKQRQENYKAMTKRDKK